MRKTRVGREKAGLGAEAETKKLPSLQPGELWGSRRTPGRRGLGYDYRPPDKRERVSSAPTAPEVEHGWRGGIKKIKRSSHEKPKVLHFGRFPALVQKFKLKKVQMHPFPCREIRSMTNDRYTGTYSESVHTRLTKRVWKSHLHHQKSGLFFF